MDTLDVQVANRDAVDLTDDQINELLYECGYSMSQNDDPLANEPILIFMDIGDFSLEDEDIVLKQIYWLQVNGDYRLSDSSMAGGSKAKSSSSTI